MTPKVVGEPRGGRVVERAAGDRSGPERSRRRQVPFEHIPAHAVRRYQPGFDADKYERTVRYDLRTIGAATGLRCSVRTRLLGANPTVLRRLPTRGERAHPRRCLERLCSVAEGDQRLPLLRRIRDSRLAPQPL